MNCAKCGQSNPQNAKFCRHCGAELKDANRQVATPVPEAVAASSAKETPNKSGGFPRWALVSALSLGALVVIGGITTAVVLMNHKPKAAVAATAPPVKGPLDVKTVIQHALPSTVYIDVTTSGGEDIGSGFVYDNEGDVLTNAHVVEGANSIEVKTHDGSSYTATIIGIDPTHDIAALRVPALTNTAPIPLGNSDGVQLGDAVVAIGNPLGLKDTVTSGIISGQDRDFQIGQSVYHNMLQISAPIAPGNSGGPLIEQSDGKVIGINSAGSTNTSGNIGFAIPINQVKTLAVTWEKSPESQSQIASAMNGSPDSGTSGTTDTTSGSGGATGNSNGTGSGSDGTSSFVQSCLDLINNYYDDISNQDYLDAYNLLSQSVQEQTTYASFMSGYTTTVSEAVQNPLVVSSTADSAEITFTLVAGASQPDGSTQYSVYHMDYTLGMEDGRIRIKVLQGNQVS